VHIELSCCVSIHLAGVWYIINITTRSCRDGDNSSRRVPKSAQLLDPRSALISMLIQITPSQANSVVSREKQITQFTSSYISRISLFDFRDGRRERHGAIQQNQSRVTLSWNGLSERQASESGTMSQGTNLHQPRFQFCL